MPLRRRPFLHALGAQLLALLAPTSAHATRAPRRHRRVVTGVVRGRSRIVSDGEVPAAARAIEPGQATASDLWVLPRVPANLTDPRDPIAEYHITAWPPAGGAVVRIVTWQPGFSYPPHRSATIDFVFVIAGRLELVLDDARTILEPGDSLVQNGTRHGFRVVGNEPCTFAGVLVSGAP